MGNVGGVGLSERGGGILIVPIKANGCCCNGATTTSNVGLMGTASMNA